MANEPKPGLGGERYIPVKDRKGAKSVVYFTRDLSSEGLRKIYEKVKDGLSGRLAVKLHTGEQHGPNIIPRPWVKDLFEQCLDENAKIVETNTYYEGDRDTTEKHLKTLEVNGWTFAPVDILDEDGYVYLPVEGGKWFSQIAHGKNILTYDSLLALTHFKGHTMGGFGGSNKNLGIGLADGKVGKKMIHARGDEQWGMVEEEFMERMTESTKAGIDHFKGHISYINVMRNMSVSCDCEGVAAEPVVTPNIGILGSKDILAIDSCSVDLIYALTEKDGHALRERMETRHGLRQLTYMEELKMGNSLYTLIDVDTGEEISLLEAVKDVVPFKE